MPYAVTKAAQFQLVKCLAVSVGPKIRVNTVLPGLLLTEWVRSPRSLPPFPNPRYSDPLWLFILLHRNTPCYVVIVLDDLPTSNADPALIGPQV